MILYATDLYLPQIRIKIYIPHERGTQTRERKRKKHVHRETERKKTLGGNMFFIYPAVIYPRSTYPAMLLILDGNSTHVVHA